MILKIRRFDPERDSQPHWERYEVPVQPGDRLLDALHWVKWNLDASLAFRRSCDQGSCGSDVMRINGENRLACTALVRELVDERGDEITIEPIKGLTAEKDLIVDMEPFFAAYREVEPWLVGGRESAAERLQSPEQVRRFSDTAKCNLCAACTSACPVYWNDTDVRGAGHDRRRPPLHLRQPRHRQRAAVGDPQRPRGGLAVPHDVQLHRGLPPGDPGHPGHPRGEAVASRTADMSRVLR